MFTNKFSIGGLIVVHVCNIVTEAIKTISSPFIFFTKIFWTHKKHENAKQTTFTLLEVFVCKKLLPLVVFCLLILVLLVDFCLICVFVRSKSFRKKINRLEIVLIASFTILLEISTNFLVYKFFGKEKFQQSFGWIAQNSVETLPLHKISTPGNYVKFWYFRQCLCLISLKLAR